MVISISLRPGNFAARPASFPDTVSFEHWRFALGLTYQDAQGRLVEPDLPGAAMAVELGEDRHACRQRSDSSMSTTAAYAFATHEVPRQEGRPLTGPDADADVSPPCWHWWPSTPSSTASATRFPAGRHRLTLVFAARLFRRHRLARCGPSRATTTRSRWRSKRAAKVDGATPWQAFSHGALADGRADTDGGVSCSRSSARFRSIRSQSILLKQQGPAHPGGRVEDVLVRPEVLVGRLRGGCSVVGIADHGRCSSWRRSG